MIRDLITFIAVAVSELDLMPLVYLCLAVWWYLS